MQQQMHWCRAARVFVSPPVSVMTVQRWLQCCLIISHWYSVYKAMNVVPGRQTLFTTVHNVPLANLHTPGLAKSLARRPGAIVFSSRAIKMYYRPARRAILNSGQGVFKALKSLNTLNGIRKVLIVISRGLTDGGGKARIAIWLD